LTDTDIEALHEGHYAIFVYGEVRYKDAFGKDRVSRYRYFTGGATGLRGPELAAHDEGNEET
jgi:hypothetical protein